MQHNHRIRTNAVVIRVVDARTGIMRDGAVLGSEEGTARLAEQVAGLVRQWRHDASRARPRVYLAVGTFVDVSPNSRQSAFPAQLRAYLTEVYRRTNVTLLEREHVATLLHEVNLDLAGLTDEATNAPTPMQSAYWLVDGVYQSYETSTLEIELELGVKRVFGRNKTIPLRDRPGDALFAKVRQAIDSALDDSWYARIPSRSNEARWHLETGRDLAHLKSLDQIHLWGFDSRGTLRWRHNIEEAIRAFETALLLEPDRLPALQRTTIRIICIFGVALPAWTCDKRLTADCRRSWLVCTLFP